MCLKIKTIKYQSPEYQELCELRNEVLRRPINLLLTEDDIQKEHNDLFIAAFDNLKIIGCCILTKINDNLVKLRQMAIKTDYQHKGIGGKILKFAEQIAKENRYHRITLHARKEATKFYEKNGYQSEGEEFIEVGIPHFEMNKQI